MNIKQNNRNQVDIVEVSGRIQIMDSDQMENVLLGATDMERPRIIVDLRNATFICSTGLGILIATKRRVTKRKGEMRLLAGSGDVLDVLRMTMVDKLFQIQSDLDEAMRSLSA